MRSKDRELRAELEAACEAVRRQIDLQQRSMRSIYGGGGDRRVLRELRETLAQLEEGLANLGDVARRTDPA
jgi:hypothetical protein